MCRTSGLHLMLDFYKVIFSSHLYVLQIFNLRPSLGVSFSFRPLTGFHTYTYYFEKHCKNLGFITNAYGTPCGMEIVTVQHHLHSHLPAQHFLCLDLYFAGHLANQKILRPQEECLHCLHYSLHYLLSQLVLKHQTNTKQFKLTLQVTYYEIDSFFFFNVIKM